MVDPIRSYRDLVNLIESYIGASCPSWMGESPRELWKSSLGRQDINILKGMSSGSITGHETIHNVGSS